MVKNLSLRAVPIYLRLLEVETVCIINFYAHVVSIQKTALGLRGGLRSWKRVPFPLPLFIKPPACCEHSSRFL